MTPSRPILRLILAALLAAWLGAAWARAPAELFIVLGDYSAPQLELVERLRQSVGPGSKTGARITVLGWREAARRPMGASLTVALGPRAVEALAAAGGTGPVLATLLNEAAFGSAVARRQGKAPFSAVYSDQPPGRQIMLLRLVLPHARRVAILGGPDGLATSAALANAATEQGLRASRESAERPEDLHMALQRALAQADCLIVLPDPALAYPDTLTGVLTTGYRRGIPMMGASPAWVQAGALMALHSTPADIGSQVADIARDVLAGRPLPPPRFPREFAVAMNPQVAASLGLPVASAAALADELRRLESRP